MGKSVQILMSTFNGEKYLRQQMDSILSQTYEPVTVLIRDDGSTDGTIDILEEYQSKYKQIQYYQGKNVGPAASFFDLMLHADAADYYAFCDQDDVWQPKKIECAVKCLLHAKNEVALYCSNVELVNEQLETIAPISAAPRLISFGNAVVEGACTGCTAVFSKGLRDLVVKKIPQNAYMHDWWLYMAASSMGQVIYDKAGFIKYRQHGNNAVGGKEGFLKHWQRRIRNYSKMKEYVPKQAREFYKLYHKTLNDEQKDILRIITMKSGNLCKRMKIFFNKNIRRNSRLDDLLYKTMFLFWKI